MISIRNAQFAKIGLEDLVAYIGKTSEKIMLEIGCYVGDSTEIFAKNFLTVHAIDPWKNGYDNTDLASTQYDMSIVEAQFDELNKKYPNIIKHKMTSLEASLLFLDGVFDFVYIDGNHQEKSVREDMKLWLPKIKKGGYLGGHDYQGRFKGTRRAVDELGAEKIFRDTSWIKKIC